MQEGLLECCRVFFFSYPHPKIFWFVVIVILSFELFKMIGCRYKLWPFLIELLSHYAGARKGKHINVTCWEFYSVMVMVLFCVLAHVNRPSHQCGRWFLIIEWYICLCFAIMYPHFTNLLIVVQNI